MGTLDPQFTFENFVVGPANRLASAAARRVAERPGVSYNPLFIYAPTGLGKTHVLGAIARHVERVYPDKRVEYQTPEEFLRAFVGASGGKGEEAVRARFQNVEILLLDDIQFLTHQPEVQELLLYTLKTLTGEGKQVVLTSDRPPAEIEGLVAHLWTQFEGGLLVDIGVPEYETRVAIITKLAKSRNASLEPGLADAIGRSPSSSVNELEEALHRVLAAQEKEGRVLSPAEAFALLQQEASSREDEDTSELGRFLDELSDTVAERVQAQEAPWRKLLREAAERAEKNGFNASRLRTRMEESATPEDLEAFLEAYEEALGRLGEIKVRLEEVGNPWPEAAHAILKDPDRVEEAEALLASAEERARPFLEMPPGPDLESLSGDLPKLVIRAADQLISTDRPEYNPLYVWSSDGMAARALLHAAGRSRLAEDGTSTVALISAVSFAEEFIRALSNGVAGAWRERWWVADLLLIDGAQDLRGTERAQEELFHLLEALGRRRARIMIAADRPPSQISALDDRLRGRLEGGLVVEVGLRKSDLSSEIQEVVQALEPRPKREEKKKEDVSAQDLEWIRSFQPKGVETGKGKGEVLDALAAGEGGAEHRIAWIPSPEQVVLEWPRLEDRIVEGAD
ncbi:MAG: DnaA/Hda family protein [Gemmatimonadota bacterium]|jgi:chromosomal replication initiation ATPase DnaA